MKLSLRRHHIFSLGPANYMITRLNYMLQVSQRYYGW